METIIDKNYGREDIYTIVDIFPHGYVVWNIGRKNFPHCRYVPLAKMSGDCNVDTTTLKAIKVETEEIAISIMNAAEKKPIEKIDFYSILHSL
jgi:hypothetical protein